MPTMSEELVRFTRDLQVKYVPEEVREAGKLHLLDALGIGIGSARADFAGGIIKTVRKQGGVGGSSSIFCTEGKFSPAWAALANGTLIHGYDYDDTHTDSITHVSACIVPTTLAAGEAEAASGEECLAAALIGWETMIRIGMAAPGRFHDRGFHATGVCGAFAATLVAGRLMKLSGEQLVNALGIAGSFASGIFEYLENGSWVKRVHPGWAAHSGIVAATMAKHGYTGPRTVFEGRFGFFRTHLGDDGWDTGEVTRTLGQTWETPNISFKPYPCCHYTHAFIDAALMLKEKYNLNCEEITNITCKIAPGQIPIVCAPEEMKLNPKTDYDAKFSLQFCVASALAEGKINILTFQDENIRNNKVLELAQKVTFEEDLSSSFPKYFSGKVNITLLDGKELNQDLPYNRGSRAWLLTREEIVQKFSDNASLVLSREQSENILKAVEKIERLDDIGELTRLLI